MLPPRLYGCWKVNLILNRFAQPTIRLHDGFPELVGNPEVRRLLVQCVRVLPVWELLTSGGLAGGQGLAFGHAFRKRANGDLSCCDMARMVSSL